ncbi:uncharacterized protein LOC135823375 isoform X2 [Sycon ciliatum]
MLQTLSVTHLTNISSTSNQTIRLQQSHNKSPSANASPALHSSGFHGSSPGGLQMKLPQFPDSDDESSATEFACPSGFTERHISVSQTGDSPRPELLRSAKRPAATQSPGDSSLSDKRKANHIPSEIQLSLKLREEENDRKDEKIVSLTEELQKLRNQMDSLKQERAREIRKLKEEVQSLRYENAQVKAFSEEVAAHHANSAAEDKVRTLEAELAVVKRERAEKELENLRLRSKVDKLNDDYVRLSEDLIMDPADSFGSRPVECTFRPISPPIDNHQCFNPTYSENCSVSNRDIATTAAMFLNTTAPATPLPTELEKKLKSVSDEEQRKKKDSAVPTSGPWWAKARAKKLMKWVEQPSLPGNSMNLCAATEHVGRLYVADTIVGTELRSHSPTPLPEISLYVLNEKEKRFVNVNVPSPPDAVYPTGLFSHENRMYMVTAQEGGDSIWRLDVSTKQWIFLSATIGGETSCAPCMVGEHIILAGGDMKDETGSCSSVKSFSVASMTWNHGWPAMRNRRHAARLLHANDCLYTVAGGTGSKLMGFDTMQTVECLPLKNLMGGWITVSSVKELAPAAMSTGSSLLLVGGLYRKPMMKRTGYAATVRFTGGGQEADELPSLNVPRSAACLVSLGTRLFCIGGCAEKGYCSVVEELTSEY